MFITLILALSFKKRLSQQQMNEWTNVNDEGEEIKQKFRTYACVYVYAIALIVIKIQSNEMRRRRRWRIVHCNRMRTLPRSLRYENNSAVEISANQQL